MYATKVRLLQNGTIGKLAVYKHVNTIVRYTEANNKTEEIKLTDIKLKLTKIMRSHYIQ